MRSRLALHVKHSFDASLPSRPAATGRVADTTLCSKRGGWAMIIGPHERSSSARRRSGRVRLAHECDELGPVADR